MSNGRNDSSKEEGWHRQPEGRRTCRKYKGQRSEREKDKSDAQRTMGRRSMDVQLGHTEEYNQGLKKPVEGQFLADLDWMRIIVNPVDGSVLCMDSKRLQDLGASNVMLDEVYGVLVVIYAWKFTLREGLASIPKNDHDGGLSENIDGSVQKAP